MRHDLLILLVLIPAVGGVLTTALRGWIAAQRSVGVGALVTTLGLSIYWLTVAATEGVVVSQIGAWPAPFGITIALDVLSGLMIAASSVVALACYVHAFVTLAPSIERDWLHPLFMLLMMGLNFAFVTGDLFNLFVAFEIVLLASYVLLCLGGSRRQLAQAYKYVLLNLLGSTFFVLGAGLIYGMAGTLNIADLAVWVAQSRLPGAEPLPPVFYAVAMILLFVFAMKAAVFPLWFWLPDTYHTCPISICALFSGLLTKLGVYSLIRIYPMAFAAEGLRDRSAVMITLAVTAGLTMTLGIIGAVGMREIRRLLALTLVAHIGYLIFGVAMMTPDALAGALFYMVQHMLVMTALFLAVGVIERRTHTDDLECFSGLARRAPWLATLFFIAAMSLVGLPALSGFWGKLLLIREGFRLADGGYWVLSVIALFTGLLTLVAMAKIWALGFWSPVRGVADADDGDSGRPVLGSLRAPIGPAYAAIAALVTASLAMSVAAEPIMKLCMLATEELSEPRAYVAAVLHTEWPEVADAAEPGAEAADVVAASPETTP